MEVLVKENLFILPFVLYPTPNNQSALLVESNFMDLFL